MTPPLPAGPFGCIVADPPWHFRSYDGKKAVPSRTQADPYATMSLEDIKALPVEQVAARDCLLLVWAVSHLLPEALDVGRAWGFRPVSLGPIWDKRSIGMGYWVRQEAEITFLFTRGSPKRLDAGVRQMIFGPRRATDDLRAEAGALPQATDGARRRRAARGRTVP